MATKPTQHWPANIGLTILFETEKFPFEKKKTGPAQIQTQGLFCPRQLNYRQEKCAGDAKKFEYFTQRRSFASQALMRISLELVKKIRIRSLNYCDLEITSLTH